MKMDRYLPPNHPLSRVYRLGAALFGTALIVFGALGLADRLAFLSTHGRMIAGLSSNGLLSTVSVVTGLVLIAAAVIGGPVASTVEMVVGGLFVLSGLANLAVLDTGLNLLAFKLQNVLFSLVAGLLVLLLGMYGRISGGLPEDNPYVRARRHEDPADDHAAERAAERQRLAEIDELARAEFAVAEGRATPEQEELVRADALARAIEHRLAAHRHAQESEQEFAIWLAERQIHPPPRHFVLWHRRRTGAH